VCGELSWSLLGMVQHRSVLILIITRGFLTIVSVFKISKIKNVLRHNIKASFDRRLNVSITVII
jgi:hypothetical protein